MGLLTNKDVNNAYRRTLAKCTTTCVIKDVRESEGKPTDDGKPPLDSTFITLGLTKDVKTTDGEDMKAGATVDISFSSVKDPGSDSKLEMMNKISMERTREFIIAALKLPLACKDPIDQLEKQGGITALAGRYVVVDFSPSKKGQNNVDKFAAVPAA